MAEVTNALDGIDLGDRGTQIMLAAGAIGVGLLIAKLRGPSAQAAPAAPADTRQPIQVAVPGGWGTRADAPNTPGAFGWVGTGNVTQPDEKPAGTNPKPADPNPADTTGMTFAVAQGTIQKGGSVSVTVGGLKMNDSVDVFLDNTTGSPLKTFVINASGGASGSVTIPAAYAGKSAYLVAQSRKTGATKTASVALVEAPKPTTPEPTKPTTPSTPAPAPTTPATGKTKFGRTTVQAQTSWPYSCPIGSTMVQEPGTTNHVCERNDNGTLFQVVYKNRGGEAAPENVTIPGLMGTGGFGAVPVPIIAETHARIKAGETIRQMAQRIYGTEAGMAVLGMLNPEIVSSDSVTEGTTFRVR